MYLAYNAAGDNRSQVAVVGRWSLWGDAEDFGDIFDLQVIAFCSIQHVERLIGYPEDVPSQSLFFFEKFCTSSVS